jgi:hypothetical protein
MKSLADILQSRKNKQTKKRRKETTRHPTK